MKRSTTVILVLSGAILSGCGKREEPVPPALKSSQVLTNDTYVQGRGYYHAPFHGFFPFPYNYYSPGIGYYRGGNFHPQPDLKIQPPTIPGRGSSPTAMQARAQSERENVNRGGFTRSRSWSIGS